MAGGPFAASYFPRLGGTWSNQCVSVNVSRVPKPGPSSRATATTGSVAPLQRRSGSPRTHSKGWLRPGVALLSKALRDSPFRSVSVTSPTMTDPLPSAMMSTPPLAAPDEKHRSVSPLGGKPLHPAVSSLRPPLSTLGVISPAAPSQPRPSLGSLAERHGPGGPAGLQNLCGVVTPRSVGSTPAPLR